MGKPEDIQVQQSLSNILKYELTIGEQTETRISFGKGISNATNNTCNLSRGGTSMFLFGIFMQQI